MVGLRGVTRMYLRSTLAVVLALAAVSSASAQTPIRITADLSEAPRRLYHAEVDIPVKAGPVTLTTPKWIPGNHRPTGPVDDIAGVVFTANGQVLPWRRDDVDLYEFHVTVPKGVTNLHAHLDAIVHARVSDHMAVLEWEKLLLYPVGPVTKDLPIQPSVTVPAGWGTGTALQPTGTVPSPPATGVNEADHGPTPGAVTTQYAVTNVEQLEDSPVITGQYFHEYPLAPEMPVKHYLDVVADQAADAEIPAPLLADAANLVREAQAAYGSYHYGTYHFLLTLSDVAGGEGLEHGQSSDNGEGEKSFSRADAGDDLLAHEYTHSWNGKYRRPARLNQPTFAPAEQGDLLWVYEGMTQYMGNVLAARSGFRSMDQYIQNIANDYATLDNKAGRDWRSTEDTAIAASILRGGQPEWSNWKRGQDYYQEGLLVWMDIDTKIRELTGGKKSLTDFQKIFLGKGGNTGPLIVGYERPELIADLNSVAPFDWGKLLHDKVDMPTEHADMDGITRGGWKLVYQDHPVRTGRRGGAEPEGASNAGDWYSVGLRFAGGGPGGRPRGGAEPSGTIADVRYGGPADHARLYPGQRVISVNGKEFSAEAMNEAIRKAKSDTASIHLIVEHEGAVTPVDLDYHDGERYPALQRVEGTPNYLADIAKPLAVAGSGGAQTAAPAKP